MVIIFSLKEINKEKSFIVQNLHVNYLKLIIENLRKLDWFDLRILEYSSLNDYLKMVI